MSQVMYVTWFLRREQDAVLLLSCLCVSVRKLKSFNMHCYIIMSFSANWKLPCVLTCFSAMTQCLILVLKPETLDMGNTLQ